MPKKQSYKNPPKEIKKQEIVEAPVSINKNTNLYTYLIIIILGFIIYGNSLLNDTALDDNSVFTNNAFTQKGMAGIPDIFKYDTFTGAFLFKEKDKDKTLEQIQEENRVVSGGRYRPLSVATFAVEVSLFGKEITEADTGREYIGNPFVSHLINLLLYIATSCLLFKILATLFPLKTEQKWFLTLPFVATLLFLAHPIHTEAIANIKGRDEIMTLLGALGALWFSMVYCKNKKLYSLLLSGFCLFLGLLSKENAITFLAVIPITLYHKKKKKSKTILITLIPLIIASVGFLLIRGSVLGFSQPKFVTNEIMNDPFIYASFLQKYATIFFTLGLYLKLLIFPHPLTHDYYPVQIPIINFSDPRAFLPFLFYLLLIVYVIYTLLNKKKSPVVSWSIWFYLLPLSIVSNLFFVIGTFMNERFIYISSIGFCLFLAWLLSDIIPKYVKNVTIISIVFISILCLYSGKTISRNTAWKNDYVLNITDVKISSNSARCNYFSGVYTIVKADLLKDNKAQHDKLYKQAITYLEKAVKLYPKEQYIQALYMLADVYYTYNYDISNSLRCYAKCLSLNNQYLSVYENIQKIANYVNELLSENQASSSPQEILESCDEVLRTVPDFGEIIHLKAVIYARFLNDLNTGIKLFEEANAVERFEKSPNFYKDMGIAYAMANNYPKALPYMLKSVELGDNDYRSYRNIAIAYQHLGDLQNAKKYLDMSKERE
jgi:tetratricopeptide (TPR) repeat protein